MTTMTAKAKTSGDRSTQLAPVILFGIDSSGKPKAARFGMKHAGLATKAASQLQLRVLQGDDPKLAEIAGRLPVGKVHATGRMFVPFVRRDLYDKLLAVAPNGGSQGGASPPPSGMGGQTGGKPAGSPPVCPPIPLGGAAASPCDPPFGAAASSLSYTSRRTNGTNMRPVA